MDHCVDHLTFKVEALIPISNIAVTVDKVAKPPVKFQRTNDVVGVLRKFFVNRTPRPMRAVKSFLNNQRAWKGNSSSS